MLIVEKSIKFKMGDFIVLSEGHDTELNIGQQIGETYQIRDETARTLQNINKKIIEDDKLSHPYRRSVLFSQIIEKDLVPILTNYQDNLLVFNSVVKLLVNLTLPVGCLLPIEKLDMCQENEVQLEINHNLDKTKTIFTNPSLTKPLMDNISAFLSGAFKGDSIEVVNDCLLLLRNILHIPEEFSPRSSQTTPETLKCERQIQILWNLFSQKFDRILLELICDKDGWAWCDTIVQLVALIYKDQHVMIIHQAVKHFTERDNEDSHDETISSAAQKDSLRSGDFASASNSGDKSSNYNSDGSKRSQKNRNNKSTYSRIGPFEKTGNKLDKIKEDSEVGVIETKDFYNLDKEKSPKVGNVPPGTEYVKSIIDNLLGKNINGTNVFDVVFDNASVSSGSSEDEFEHVAHMLNPGHNQNMNGVSKKYSLAEKKELRGLKIHHKEILKPNITPNNRVITALLQEFAIDFLLQGYSTLVRNVLEQLLRQSDNVGDESYFLWLITYFLKFTVHLQLDQSQMRALFSFPILSYLTFAGVKQVEHVELITQGGGDERIHLRKIHLVVTALREFFQAIHLYESNPTLSTSDMEEIRLLYLQLGYSREIRQIILLLLKNFKPEKQPLDYLNDLIVTNNLMLLKINLVDKYDTFNLAPKVNMDDHIRQFANPVVMCRYGRILEKFSENSFQVNEAVFSMMHHIARKLQQPEKLCRMGFLKSFAKIWKQRKKVSEEFTDLIEYIIQHFMDDVNTRTESEKAELPMWSLETVDSITGNDTSADAGVNYGNKKSTRKQKIKELIFWEFGPEKPPESDKGSEYGSDNSMFVSTRSQTPLESTASKDVEERAVNDEKDTEDDAGENLSDKHSNGRSQGSSQNETLNTNNLELLEGHHTQRNLVADTAKHIGEQLLCDSWNNRSPLNGMLALPVNGLVTKSLSKCVLKREKDVTEEIFQRTRKRLKVAHSDSEITRDSEEETENFEQEIKRITDCLEKQKSGGLVRWFQDSLLDACRVKIHPDCIIPAGSHIPHEPIPFYYNLTKQSIPLVPWTEEQHHGLYNEAFILLMHKVGVHLPESLGKVFPRIPHYWTAGYMYAIATKLGQIDTDNLRFHIDDLDAGIEEMTVGSAGMAGGFGQGNSKESSRNLSLLSNVSCDWQKLAARSKGISTKTTMKSTNTISSI